MKCSDLRSNNDARRRRLVADRLRPAQARHHCGLRSIIEAIRIGRRTEPILADARQESAIGRVYQFASAPTFVNDVVLTPDAAWFTDSLNPVLYKVPLDRHGGLPDPDGVVGLPLTGDLVFQEGFNTNGISRTPDGSGLLVVQTVPGLLFRVDPATGVTTQVDLGGQTVPKRRRILLSGRTLYVVQNVLNQVAVVRLDHNGTSGRIVGHLTDPRLDVPTTVAQFGSRLYLPNARFTTPPTPTTPYSAVAIGPR